jgi:hypothetical protein
MQTPTMCFFSHFTAACFWFSEALELSDAISRCAICQAAFILTRA